jgi:arylsulfatase A-like enzyme
MTPPDRAPALPAADLAALTANYDDEVRFVDRAFGELLDGLRERGLLEKTVVLFLSDHGEEFHEHGGWTHEHSLHEEVVRVPAVLGGPGLPRGVRDDRDARIEDLLPTLLEAAGLRAAGPFEGESLLPRYRPGAPPGPAAPTTGRASRDSSPLVLRSALLGEVKVIRGEGGGREWEAWFDLAKDPLEQSPLAAPPPALVEGLRRTLREARERETLSPMPPSTEVEGDLRRVLEGLGYFGGGSPR